MKNILIILLTYSSLIATIQAQLVLNFDASKKEFYLTGSASGSADDENVQSDGVMSIDYEGPTSSLSSKTYRDTEGYGRTLFVDSGLYLLNNEVPPTGNVIWLSGENYDTDDTFINLRIAFSPLSSNKVKVTGTGQRASYANLNASLIEDIENSDGLKLDLVDGAGFSDVVIRVQSKYSGIYQGTFEENTPDYGYDSGIFIAFVDSENNVTLWNGNEDWGNKYRFKINAQGYGSFRSSDGYNVNIQFNSDGGINLSLGRGATASVTTTKVDFPYTPGAATLLRDFMTNPTFYSNNPLELSLDEIGQNQMSSALEDQLALLSGEWNAKAKATVNNGYGGTVNVSLTGDMIITPSGIFFYTKAQGESALIRQDASITSYNDINLTSAAYDFAKRTLSASGNVTIDGYNGTLSYTIKQTVSYYDTDKDGLSDYEEINTHSTNPLKADSDGDRLSDYAELEAGTNPNDKSEYPAYLKVQVSLAKGIPTTGESNATALINGASYPVSLVRGKGTLQVALPTGSTYTVSASMGALTSGSARSVAMIKAQTLTLVLDGDSDEDGLPDSLEARYKGDPNNPDTDGDGISDGEEVYEYRTRVNLADTDKDGLSDYEEINTHSTNPLKADSDGDRLSDYAELEAGTNPNDKSEYPAYLKVQVSLAKGIPTTGESNATALINGASYPVSLVRGKGTLQVALPTGSTYTVSASMGALTSGSARSVAMIKAQTLTLVLDGDSDEDGLPDSLEARYKGDPNNPDTDGDGISDGEEVYEYRTRVNLADTDKDGFTDKQEIDLETNPLSPKDKPAAYIERPVLIDWLLTYESTDGYINESWDTAAVAYFLSSAMGDPQQGASIYLKYSLDGSNLKWIVRNNSGDIDVTSLMRPIKVSKPAQLNGEVISPIADDGSYYVAQMFSLAINEGKTKSLSLVVAGQSTSIPVGENSSGLDIDLAIASDYTALGLLKDSSMSDGPILIEGTLTMGYEVANVLGQSIGPVNLETR